MVVPVSAMILLFVLTSSSVRRAGVIAALPVENPVKESCVQVWLKMWWPSSAIRCT